MVQKILPWDYQQDAVHVAWALLQEQESTLIVSPPGSGKTVMIALAARMAVRRGWRVLVLSHRKELVDQSYNHFLALGLNPSQLGVVMADTLPERVNPRAVVQAASIQTYSRRLPAFRPDLVIVDEAHHALADGYQQLLDQFPRARHLGFTATPFRLDGRGLGDFYTKMIIAAKPSELIARQKMARPVLYRAPEEFMPDLSSLKLAYGDYIISKLEKRANRKELVGGIVDNYRLRAEGRTAIAFAVTIEHSRAIATAFVAAGVPAEHLDGEAEVDERERVLDRLKNRKTMVVSCCMILSEGYDLPSCQAVVLARPTNSLCLYLQQAGRGLRYYGNQRPVIFDHGRNFERFGLPEADRDYELTTSKLSATKAGSCPVKECPDCQVVVAAGCKECPECGHVFILDCPVPDETEDLLARYASMERRTMRTKLSAYAAKKGWGDEWTEKVLTVWAGA
jgi:DNA repair protein RadD